MNRRIAVRTLVVLLACLGTIQAQDKKTKQAEKKLSELLNEFNADLRGYEKELKHFQAVPDAESLMEIRKDLVKQAAEMGKLRKVGRGSGPAILKLAKEMDAKATKLDEWTAALEKHAKNVAQKEDRAVAARMRTHADSLVKSVESMMAMFR